MQSFINWYICHRSPMFCFLNTAVTMVAPQLKRMTFYFKKPPSPIWIHPRVMINWTSPALWSSYSCSISGGFSSDGNIVVEFPPKDAGEAPSLSISNEVTLRGPLAWTSDLNQSYIILSLSTISIGSSFITTVSNVKMTHLERLDINI